MTVKGGTTPACAACKYQRRKCSPNCPLAPYFPANQPRMFQNVHRLFGVKNVTKTLKDLDTKDQKDDAMKSIIYEANMRERFPVHGCWEIIARLRQQLHLATEELRHVYAQIEVCKQQMMNKQFEQPLDWPPMEFGSSSSNEVNQFLLNDNSGFCAPSTDIMTKPLLTLDPHCDNLNGIQSQLDAFSLQDRNIYAHSEGEQFNRSIEDGQPCNEPKDAFQSSSKSSLKDDEQVEQECRRELKKMAAANAKFMNSSKSSLKSARPREQGLKMAAAVVEHGCRREAAQASTLTSFNKKDSKQLLIF